MYFCFEGYVDGRLCRWTEEGFVRLNVRDKEDIIGPWEEQETVSSVLTYAGITKKPSDVLTWIDFVTVMSSPDLTFASSPKAEKQSEDEAKGNTACDEAGDAVAVLSKCLDDADSNCYGIDVYTENAAEKLYKLLQDTGYSIVRTSTLGNRNGCYNTRTDKDVD